MQGDAYRVQYDTVGWVSTLVGTPTCLPLRYNASADAYEADTTDIPFALANVLAGVGPLGRSMASVAMRAADVPPALRTNWSAPPDCDTVRPCTSASARAHTGAHISSVTRLPAAYTPHNLQMRYTCVLVDEVPTSSGSTTDTIPAPRYMRTASFHSCNVEWRPPVTSAVFEQELRYYAQAWRTGQQQVLATAACELAVDVLEILFFAIWF